MKQLVFDIETCSVPYESLSESQQEYIIRDAAKIDDPELREKKEAELISWLSLYPFTAKVVAIGMIDVDKKRGSVYYEKKVKEEYESEDGSMTYKGMPESEMLSNFWRVVKEYNRIISFNGRGFDVPFLMLRSALLKIKPTKNLMGNRFDVVNHLDLLEQLTFYGSFRKFNLDFYCHSFGITSPKSKGVSGIDVKVLYESGKIREIAEYCGDDIKATLDLFIHWNEYLNFAK
ncbi:MAG: ribonuclease H-like domain-containing protein [Ignavibacteriaceae bacterium]|nr:ribonuclease H-like domain-containing protein [Ignavibacteriaceae bacterium]